MDLSQLTNPSTDSTGAQVQGAKGHHRHHKSISDQMKDMESAIDNAVSAGKLTNDQAAAMKTELDDAKQTLGQNQTSGSNQTGSMAQLSDDDRKKVFNDIQDVRKQLHTAIAPQGSSSQASGAQMNQLFVSMDGDGNGSISKDEFEAFMNNLAQTYTAKGTPPQNAESALQGGLSLEA